MGCRRLQGSKLTGKKDAGCSELDGPFGDIEKAIGIHSPGFDLRGNPLLRCAITVEDNVRLQFAAAQQMFRCTARSLLGGRASPGLGLLAPRTERHTDIA